MGGFCLWGLFAGAAALLLGCPICRQNAPRCPPPPPACCRPPTLPHLPHTGPPTSLSLLQAAERDYDLNRAAELKYGTLLELQKQLKEAELLLDQADSQVGGCLCNTCCLGLPPVCTLPSLPTHVF